mmetsp:Transcript_83428/g.231552  ORF Transcript_83428/g.231552 Transcript_83428/m.231552 type:complete len:137 (-) Transcript_83428:194-604(-)
MCAAVDKVGNPWRRSTEAGNIVQQAEAQRREDFEKMLEELQFCPPCRTDLAQSGLTIPLSDQTMESGDLIGSSEGKIAEAAKAVDGTVEQPTTRRSTWIGRAAWSLGEYAADAMLPQCSCHDPITGFLVHGLQRRR